MADNGKVVIVGGGHAGFQVAASLRQAKFAGGIVVLSEEPGLPYHRPPLSKEILTGAMAADALRLRPETFYAKSAVELRAATRAVAIERAGRAVVVESGERIGYDHLVLATGSRHRRLRVAGSDLGGVLALRTREEAIALKARLDAARDLVVIGAGFIGLEVSAVARARGLNVTILEAGLRPLARAVSAPISAALAAAHRRWGAVLHTGVSARAFDGRAGEVSGVETSEGTRIAADLVLVGIGVQPNVELAAACGLATENGIVVDAHLLTADPAISAIGDCAAHPSAYTDGLVRLESVQNANDQARTVARRIAGAATAPYTAVPWFWSDQGPLKLQIAGLVGGYTHTATRGDPAGEAFSVFCYGGERLLGVESINQPSEHMAARKLLELRQSPAPEQAADPAYVLA